MSYNYFARLNLERCQKGYFKLLKCNALYSYVQISSNVDTLVAVKLSIMRYFEAEIHISMKNLPWRTIFTKRIFTIFICVKQTWEYLCVEGDVIDSKQVFEILKWIQFC